MGVGWLAIPPLAFLLAFFLVPLGLMVERSLFVPGEGFTLENYRQLVETEVFRRGLLDTLEIAAISTAVTAFMGAFLLAALRRWGPRRRAALVVALLVPFFASEVVRIVTWVVILGPQGPVEHVLSWLPWSDGPVGLVKNRTAIVIAVVNVILPFFVLTAYPAVRAIEREKVRAAEALGASPPVALAAVFVPLALPGLIAAGIVSFVLTLGYYATPAALGGPGDLVFSTLIVTQASSLGNTPQAAALGVALLAVTLLALLAMARVGGLRMIYEGAGARGGEGPRRRAGRLSRAWYAAVMSRPVDRATSALERVPGIGRAIGVAHAAIVALIVVFLVAPVAVVLPASLTSKSILTFPPRGLSTRWYEEFFADRAWTSGFSTSVEVALLTALLAIVLGLAVAGALVRGRARAKGPLLSLFLLPLVMPSVVTALGLLLLLKPLGLAYTTFGIVIGHTVFALPYAVIVLTAALQALDWNLVRAAQSAGAKGWQRLRDVILPLLRPAVLSALVFCFIISFSEFTFAYLMRTLERATLPVKLWDGLQYGTSPTSAAASGVIVLALFAAWLLATLLRRGAEFITSRKGNAWASDR
jgi:ABC-type spermidine/putrescine transport system permease subunit II